MTLDEAKTFGTHRGFVPAMRPESMALFHRRAAAGDARFTRLRSAFEREMHGLIARYERESSSDDEATSRAAFGRLKRASMPAFRYHYRRAYLAGAAAASGTLRRTLPVPSRDWVLDAAKSEAGYWDRFMRQLRDGELRHDPATRVGWYADSLSAVFDAGKVAAAVDMVIIWRVDPQAEHCPDCLRLERSGPYVRESLPTTPRAGDCKCLFQCKCRLIFRAPDSARELFLLRTRGANAKSLLMALMGNR